MEENKEGQKKIEELFDKIISGDADVPIKYSEKIYMTKLYENKINLIKEHTKCDITVGQNGVIWISGESTDAELFAKKAIMFIIENFFMEGLTEEMEKWFEGEGSK